MQFGSRFLSLATPHVMGVLNVTPDSFSDGGHFWRDDGDISPAIKQAEAMINAGASFIDVGGESTRPGAKPVGLQEEMDRVLPVIEAINRRLDTIISLDTSSAQLMTEGAALGAGLINDVRALQGEEALTAAAQTGLPVCLMHMRGRPDTMQLAPGYHDVVAEVQEFFLQRLDAATSAGISADRIILDPGFGFGKTDPHNLHLLKHLHLLGEGRYPLLVGLSRKSMLGRLLGRDTSERLAGSLALAQYALGFGASILRVHDVAETVDIIKLHQIISSQSIVKPSEIIEKE